MVQLIVKQLLDHPPPRQCSREYDFISCNGEWTAQFHDPYERSMGFPCWELSLRHQGNDVTHEHKAIHSLSPKDQFVLSVDDRPWCGERELLALRSAESFKLYVYDVDQRYFVGQTSSCSFGIQWAPMGEVLALLHQDRIELLSAEAKPIADVPFRQVPHGGHSMFWWPDGKSVFLVHRTSRRAKVRLTQFNAFDGHVISTTRFDPADFVPYDTEEYSEISRGRYTLRTSPSTMTSGSLLDVWSRVEFDQENRVLRGYVYRPSSPISEVEGQDLFGLEGQRVCDAVEQAVELSISID